jgi:hypothetical protein
MEERKPWLYIFERGVCIGFVRSVLINGETFNMTTKVRTLEWNWISGILKVGSLLYICHSRRELLPVHLLRKPPRLCAVPRSSACVLRPESCLGTCQRSSSKTCPPVLYASKHCSSRSDHRLCLLVFGPSRISIVRQNLNRHHRCLTARPSLMQEPNANEAIGPSSSSRTIGPCTGSFFEFC